MLAVDLMHEFELGVWRTLFIELIRLLCVAGKGSDSLVSELDSRSLNNSFVVDIIYLIQPADIVKSQHLLVIPFESLPRIHQK